MSREMVRITDHVLPIKAVTSAFVSRDIFNKAFTAVPTAEVMGLT